MRTFIGWVPTVTGRLSFSRFGDSVKGWSVFCNRTKAPTGLAYGVVRRTSRDFPYPAWVARLTDKWPDTDFVFFLRVEAGKLPYPKGNCFDAGADDPDTVLRDDARAELVGEVYWINGWLGCQKDRVLPVLNHIRDSAAEHGSDIPDHNVERCRASFSESKDEMERLWSELVSIASDPNAAEETPNFGRASVRLARTGRCSITVGRKSLFTLEELILAQRSGPDGSLWGDYADLVSAEEQVVAEHCFFAVRDLQHRHYHHRPEADLVTTAYEVVDGDDASWRRETQYGLVRMAISVRRQDSAMAYRNALGVIAYADAFQKHMTSWFTDAEGQIRASQLRYDYDFEALRDSLNASLRVREAEDQGRLRRYVFIVASVLTAGSLLVPRIAALPADQLEGLTHGARGVAHTFQALIRHPIEAVAITAFIAYLVDIVIFRISVQPSWLEGFYLSVKRAAYGLWADRRRESRGRQLSKAAALFWLGVFVALMGGAAACVSFLGFKLWVGAI